jgi:hypothetical protein
MDQNDRETTVNEQNPTAEIQEQLELNGEGFSKSEIPENSQRVSDDPRRAQLQRSIDEVFNTLTPGMKVSVNRLKPKWAAGWVDTFDIEFDEYDQPVIDLGEIKEAYGGEKLFLRFLDSKGRYVSAATVDFRGVPPRDNGIEVEHPRLKEQRQMLELEQRQKMQQQATAQTNGNELLLKLLLDMQERSTSQMFKVLEQKNSSSKPFGQIEELLTALDRLDGFRQHPQQSQQNDPGEIGGMISGLVSMLGQSANQKQEPPRRPQPSQQRIPPRMPPAGLHQNVVPFQQMPQQAPPKAAPVETKHDISPPVKNEAPSPESLEPETDEPGENDLDIVDELAGMDDEELAETVAELLGQIGEERMAKIMTHFDRLAKAQ